MKFQRENSNSNRKRQFPSGIVFSGVIIAFSFIAMVVPLALFHLAQIAATLRLRTALALLTSVIAAVLLLGTVTQQGAILSGGLTGLFWAPLFAFALHQRLRGGSLWASALVLCIPAFVMLLFAFSVPAEGELEISFRAMNELIQKQSLPSGSADVASSPMATLFSLDGPTYAILRDFAALDSWQRLSWFVFDKGAPIFLAALGISLANLVFLDFGVEQVERLRAIAHFVQSNEFRFSPRLVEGLRSLAAITPFKESRETTLQVTSSRHFDEYAEFEERPILSHFLRPKRPAHAYHVWGFEFLLKFPQKAWQLRKLYMPVWLVLGAVVFFGALVLGVGSPEEVIKMAQGGWGAPLALGGLVSLIILTLVALQGLIVVLERLAPNAIVIALVGVVLLSIWFPTNIFYLLGGFGILGILDYKYDFRGCLAKCAKAV